MTLRVELTPELRAQLIRLCVAQATLAEKSRVLGVCDWVIRRWQRQLVFGGEAPPQRTTRQFPRNLAPRVASMIRSGATTRDICRALRMSMDTLYRIMAEHPEMPRGRAGNPPGLRSENAIALRDYLIERCTTKREMIDTVAWPNDRPNIATVGCYLTRIRRAGSDLRWQINRGAGTRERIYWIES